VSLANQYCAVVSSIEVQSAMVFPSWARRCCQTPLGTTTGASDAWAAEMCPCAGYYLISFDHKEEIDFAASFSAVCRN